ncbi:hypothetical protein MPSEU_000683200 [Mayamaea pseudoterrestris]|nr:hypothetical protein MPSEU_000683200 [Mayamaea pseudoterrestris]
MPRRSCATATLRLLMLSLILLAFDVTLASSIPLNDVPANEGMTTLSEEEMDQKLRKVLDERNLQQQTDGASWIGMRVQQLGASAMNMRGMRSRRGTKVKGAKGAKIAKGTNMRRMVMMMQMAMPMNIFPMRTMMMAMPMNTFPMRNMMRMRMMINRPPPMNMMQMAGPKGVKIPVPVSPMRMRMRRMRRPVKGAKAKGGTTKTKGSKGMRI